MHHKEFRTIEQQLELLKIRGVIIDDEEKAMRELYGKNYYRLSGYMLHKKQNNLYHDLEFDEIIRIYNFDSRIRNILIYFLEHIEIEVKTKFAYFYAEQYGSVAYLENNLFEDIKKCLKKNEKHIILKHYQKNYNNEVPIWVSVEFITFGCLSKCIQTLYKSDKLEDKRFIKYLSKKCCGVSGNYFTNWLKGLVLLRNICAHAGRLFNFNINYSPLLSKNEKNLVNENSKHKLYVYLMLIEKMLVGSQNICNEFKNVVNNTIIKYDFEKNLKYYGFPDNYKDLFKIYN